MEIVIVTRHKIADVRAGFEQHHVTEAVETEIVSLLEIEEMIILVRFLILDQDVETDAIIVGSKFREHISKAIRRSVSAL